MNFIVKKGTFLYNRDTVGGEVVLYLLLNCNSEVVKWYKTRQNVK